jgi:hypothetical protein
VKCVELPCAGVFAPVSVDGSISGLLDTEIHAAMQDGSSTKKG